MRIADLTTHVMHDGYRTLIFVVNNGVDIKELKVDKVSLEDWATKPRHVESARKR